MILLVRARSEGRPDECEGMAGAEQLVVRREMEVVVSCGGMRQERPPIVLENLLSSLDSLWGAGGAGGGLLLQRPQVWQRVPEPDRTEILLFAIVK